MGTKLIKMEEQVAINSYTSECNQSYTVPEWKQKIWYKQWYTAKDWPADCRTKENHKFPGIMLDKGLSWQYHAENVLETNISFYLKASGVN